MPKTHDEKPTVLRNWNLRCSSWCLPIRCPKGKHALVCAAWIHTYMHVDVVLRAAASRPHWFQVHFGAPQSSFSQARKCRFVRERMNGVSWVKVWR